MIQILDNYLPTPVFSMLQEYASMNDFSTVRVGEKEFSVLETPKEILRYLQINDFELTLTFIRQAHKDFDTDMRVHADGIINNKKTHLARVLYLNNEGELKPNGTCFYNHVDLGQYLPQDVSEEEFNRLILEDAENPLKWIKTDVIHSRPNRLLTYDANLWHSKWPRVIKKGVRKVLVAFYSKE